MLVLDTNIYWTSWYLQLLPCMLPLYICLNLWLAVAVAALTNLPVTSVHISQLGGPSIWFLHTYLLLSRYTQWRHMWFIHGWTLWPANCRILNSTIVASNLLLSLIFQFSYWYSRLSKAYVKGSIFGKINIKGYIALILALQLYNYWLCLRHSVTKKIIFISK